MICKILGVPLKDEPTFHGWIFDFMAGADMGPDAKTEEGQARLQKGRESTAALPQYMADLIQGFLEGTAGQRAVQAGQRHGRPGRTDDTRGGRGQYALLLRSPVMTRRSTPSPTAC